MKIRTFENFDAFEKYHDKHEIKPNEFTYIHEHGRHNLDGEVKAKTAQAAKAKLIEAMESVGLRCGYDDDILNDLSQEGRDIEKIEVEALDDNLYYVNYIVSDSWAL